jgi:hypothetical protein
MSEQTTLHKVILQLSNRRSIPVTLYLEPWGDIYEFLPGDEVVIVVTGPDPVTPELVDEDESITFYGWTGSHMQAFKNGEVLVDYTGIQVPPFPQIRKEDPS